MDKSLEEYSRSIGFSIYFICHSSIQYAILSTANPYTPNLTSKSSSNTEMTDQLSPDSAFSTAL